MRQAKARSESGGGVACAAQFVMGLFDTKMRKLIDPTDAWLACFGWARDDWIRGAERP